MIILDKEYPEQCSGCFAMRCQKCVIMDSKSVFDYLVKDATKKKPDWCPCRKLSELIGSRMSVWEDMGVNVNDEN